MPGPPQPRSLPGRPNLRHLKLEAKRRLAAGEGADVDATAAVTTRIGDQRTHVVLTTRMIPVNSIESRLLRAWTNPT